MQLVYIATALHSNAILYNATSSTLEEVLY